MFSLLESKKEIAKAQKLLEAVLRRDLTMRSTKDIGSPGGRILGAEVFHNSKYWFYSKDSEKYVATPRRLNLFGIFHTDSVLNTSVQINIPYEGQSNQVAGFFARNNNTGMIYLFHSGGIGGGMKGVGKTDFLAWSGEPLEKVLDSSGDIREGILVMPVEGMAASRSAIRYIDIVARFKLAVRAGYLETPEFKQKKQEYVDFYPEPRGRRTGRRSTEIDYLSRHGDVVDALKIWRMSKPFPKDGRIVKNVLIDMGVAVGRELVEIFEVKTSTARSDIYGAIGQLMVHGTADKCRRVIVLPCKEKIAVDLIDAFQRLNIELVRFELDEHEATIV